MDVCDGRVRKGESGSESGGGGRAVCLQSKERLKRKAMSGGRLYDLSNGWSKATHVQQRKEPRCEGG